VVRPEVGGKRADRQLVRPELRDAGDGLVAAAWHQFGGSVAGLQVNRLPRPTFSDQADDQPLAFGLLADGGDDFRQALRPDGAAAQVNPLFDSGCCQRIDQTRKFAPKWRRGTPC